MFVFETGNSILSQAPRNLILVIIDGPKKGEKVVLRPGEVCVVGRTSAANLACEDQYMSSKHFEVVNRIEDFSVRDLNSRNGTRVRDESISELSLTHSSTVKAGTSIFELAWEHTHEEWGTQMGSSLSMKRNSIFNGPNSALLNRNSSAAYSTAPGEQSHHSDLNSHSGIGSHESNSVDCLHSAIFADQCLRVFHPPTGPIPNDPLSSESLTGGREGVGEGFKRLYCRQTGLGGGSIFFHEGLLGNFSFFAIANFAKLGVDNPTSLPWYPVYPGLDLQSRCSPVAIARKPWLESCQARWGNRLASYDSLMILLTETSVNPEGILRHLHVGMKSLFQTNSASGVGGNGTSFSDSPGNFPWYEPSLMMMFIGGKTESQLCQWIPNEVFGILIPHGMSKTTYAIVRPRYSTLLVDAGFQTIPW